MNTFFKSQTKNLFFSLTESEYIQYTNCKAWSTPKYLPWSSITIIYGVHLVTPNLLDGNTPTAGTQLCSSAPRGYATVQNANEKGVQQHVLVLQQTKPWKPAHKYQFGPLVGTCRTAWPHLKSGVDFSPPHSPLDATPPGSRWLFEYKINEIVFKRF